MKKHLITTALILTTIAANSQELLSKKGFPILPESKDWGLGFDATPFLKYAGNFFNHSDNNNVFTDYVNNLNITGLYVKNPTTAYRARVGINFNSVKQDYIEPSALNQGATIVNTQKQMTNDVTLGAGLQKMRGKGRLHGVYGAELFVSVGSGNASIKAATGDTIQVNGKITIEYAEALSAENTNGGAARNKELKAGNLIGFGLRGFIGAEYFFAPKISLKAEYGWGFGLTSQGEGSATGEQWNGSEVAIIKNKSGKSTSFGLNTDNSGGAIVLTCYF